MDESVEYVQVKQLGSTRVQARQVGEYPSSKYPEEQTQVPLTKVRLRLAQHCVQAEGSPPAVQSKHE